MLIAEKYHPTFYSLKKFNNFKNNFNAIKHKNVKTNLYINNIEINGKKLLISSYNYLDNEDNEHIIKIFGTKISMSNLSNKSFTHFFVDSTYRCVPNNFTYKALLLIIGCNNSLNDKFELCSAILLSHEDPETLSELYYYLNLIWKFEPKRITYDFAQGNIKAINKVFGNKNEKYLVYYT